MYEDLKNVFGFLSKNNLLKFSELDNNDLYEDWAKLLEEVDAPYKYPSTFSKIRKLQGVIINSLSKAKELSGIDKNTLEELAKAAPIKEIQKFAKENHTLIKSGTYEESFIKNASFWSFTKTLSLSALRYAVPFVSLIFAIVHFYFFITEFYRFVTQVLKLNITWQEALSPSFLKSKIEELKDSPKEVTPMVALIKTDSIMITNFISTVLSYLDFVKDIIFFIIDVASAGGSIAIDIGISVVLFLVELGANTYINSIYKELLDNIRGLAINNIIDIMFQETEEKEQD
jgi:hypothetical protein